jgi:nucleotide-binding universal stress UspA family protein
MKILLATDGSECSEEAARFLTRFNFLPEDKIDVVHVISQIPYDDDYYAQIKRTIKKVAPKILRSSVDILKPVKAKITSYEEEGYPDTALIDFATNSEADLIVMGARGIKGMKLLFLGSSTRSVSINSPKPVLVVKNHNGKTGSHMKVLLATDGSAPAHSAGRLLSLLPFPDDTEVALIHISWSAASVLPEKFIMEINERTGNEEAGIMTQERSETEKTIELTRSYLSNRFRKIHVITRTGDPSMEILNAEKILGPDIIAVGCRGLRGVRGMLGSVSRRILGHSCSSVLIGKTCDNTGTV